MSEEETLPTTPMADVNRKQDRPDETLTVTKQNRSLNRRPATKRRTCMQKASPPKWKTTNANTSGQLLKGRQPNGKDHRHTVNSSHSLSCTEYARQWSSGARKLAGSSRETAGLIESRTVARLNAELEVYKQENRQLRARLAEAINLKEMEKTLRMTLHSFGVPTPDSPRNACHCSQGYELPWQSEPELPQIISSNDEEEEMITEFPGAIPSQMPTTRQRDERAAQPLQHSQLQPQLLLQPHSKDARTGTLHPSTLGNALQDYTNASKHVADSPATNIELVPSSGIFVNSTQLGSIAFKKNWSYTLLTRSLMPMVFSKEEMAASCVRGERATGKGSLNSPPRPALDQAKVEAIIKFVSSQFPDVQPYQITQTMNQKLVDVRGTIRKRKQVVKL
ncbi:uncharacterized protein LOC110988846 [Acanthaster planci]|uniref:Uncharacterized protein LOC110988846 n=1 Tax=Acanthaster planci TaxID=133434 RepID=A0A8B7ZSQ1_ACAPL|nr:uncharacterized protein LOC110988846 [Acanthaster planci]